MKKIKRLLTKFYDKKPKTAKMTVGAILTLVLFGSVTLAVVFPILMAILLGVAMIAMMVWLFGEFFESALRD